MITRLPPNTSVIPACCGKLQLHFLTCSPQPALSAQRPHQRTRFCFSFWSRSLIVSQKLALSDRDISIP